MKGFEVRVNGGYFRVNESQDADYPGIDVEFIANGDFGQNLSRPRVLFEKTIDGQLRVLVWNNKDSEEYTDEIMFDMKG